MQSVEQVVMVLQVLVVTLGELEVLVVRVEQQAHYTLEDWLAKEMEISQIPAVLVEPLQ